MQFTDSCLDSSFTRNGSSGTIDIVAQAMELSSIPTDMNNKNFDIVSQAMELSDISSDIMMDF